MPLHAITLGADIKITPQKKAALIEVNGTNSGLEGFRALHGNEKLKERRTVLEKARTQYSDQVSWALFNELPIYQDFLKESNPEDMGNPDNIVNPLGVMSLTNNKYIQKMLFPAEVCAPYAYTSIKDPTSLSKFVVALNSKELMRQFPGNTSLLNLETHPYVVLKRPAFSEAGSHVHIHDAQDINEIWFSCLALGRGQEAILEGFVPSKPIIHQSTGEQHDGCMRLNVDYLVNTERKTIQTLFALSYWRLSPAPLRSDAPLEERFKANVHGHKAGLVERTTQEDYVIAKYTLDKVVQSLVDQHEGIFVDTPAMRKMVGSTPSLPTQNL